MPLVLFSLASCGDVSTTSAATTSAEATSTGAPTTPTPTTPEPTTTPAPAPAITDVYDYSAVLDLTNDTAKNEVVRISGVVENVDDSDAKLMYGNFYLSDPLNGKTIQVYGASATETALVKEDAGDGTYKGTFTNPKDFNNIYGTGADKIEEGDYVTLVGVASSFNNKGQLSGAIIDTKTMSDVSTLSYKYCSKSKVTYAEGVTSETALATVKFDGVAEGADASKIYQLDWNQEVKFALTVEDGYEATVSLDRGYEEVSLDGKNGVYSFNAGCINNVIVNVAKENADVIKLNTKTLKIGSAYGDSTSTIKGTSFSSYQCADYGDGIQMRYKNSLKSAVSNTTATARAIKSIEVTFNSAKHPAGTAKEGLFVVNSGTAVTSTTDTSKGAACDFDGTNYTVKFDYAETDAIKFFSLVHTPISGTAYFSSIVVTMYPAA